MTEPSLTSAAPENNAVSQPDRRRNRRSVLFATIMFGAMCLGMLTLYRPFLAADELYQFDRVIAASEGYILLDPEEIHINSTSIAAQSAYVRTYQTRGDKALQEFQPTDRGDRPSLNELGGEANRFDPNQRPNYMTQHPPGYYLLMGVLKNQIPYSDDIPVDQLIFWLRLFNILLVLPLPYLCYRAVSLLAGAGPLARAAAFLPMIMPGLARSASSINNDNLAILAGGILLVLLIKVMLGDGTRRTAIFVALAALVGTMAKATVLPLLPIVVLAYAILWWRRRALSPPGTMVVLVIGALLASAWALRLKIRFGSIQPSAMGPIYSAKSTGAPRPPEKPFDPEFFFDHVWKYLPGRFWANLGILEPPSLPRWLIVGLTFTVLIAAVIAVVLTKRIRLELLVLIAAGIGIAVLVVGKAYLNNRKYMNIPGLQGRYIYPAIIGLLIPIVFALRHILRRHERWATVILAVGGGAISVTALWQIIQYYWMPKGEAFGIGTIGTAFHYIGGWGTWPSIITAGLSALTAAGLVVPIVLVVLDTIRTPSAVPAEIVGYRATLEQSSVPVTAAESGAAVARAEAATEPDAGAAVATMTLVKPDIAAIEAEPDTAVFPEPGPQDVSAESGSDLSDERQP